MSSPALQRAARRDRGVDPLGCGGGSVPEAAAAARARTGPPVRARQEVRRQARGGGRPDSVQAARTGGPATDSSTHRGSARVHRRDPRLPRLQLRVDRRRRHPSGSGDPVHVVTRAEPASSARHASRAAAWTTRTRCRSRAMRWDLGSRLIALHPWAAGAARRDRRRATVPDGASAPSRSLAAGPGCLGPDGRRVRERREIGTGAHRSASAPRRAGGRSRRRPWRVAWSPTTRSRASEAAR